MGISVTVTGHTGDDIYTRYVPGRLSQTDDTLQREMAYDLHVPAGAPFHSQMLTWFGEQAQAFERVDCISGPPTLPSWLHFLHRYKWKDRSVLRIKRRTPLILREPPGYGEWKFPELPASPSDFLVVHYERSHQSQDATESLERHLSHVFRSTTENDPGRLKVFVVFGERMPAIHLDRSNNPHATGISSDLLKLLRNHRDQVAMICSATALRRAGAAISRRLSWEQTIEDTVAEFRHCELLRALSGFRHLIILFGMVAALHVEKPKGQPSSAHFVFAPNTRDLTFRDKFVDGEAGAQASSVVSFLLRDVSQSPETPGSLAGDSVLRALRDSLTLNMRWFDCGFPTPDPRAYQSRNGAEAGRRFLAAYFDGKGGEKDPSPQQIVAEGYDELLRKGRIRPDRMLGTIKLDLRQLGAVKQSKTYNRWQIFRDQVTDKEISRINLGIAICRFGHRVVLNRELDTGRAHSGGHNDNHAEEIRAVLSQPQLRPLDGEVADDKPLPKGAHVAVPDRSLSHQVKIPGDASLYVPVIEFGDLVAIERDEMESFRSIRNLMKAYVEAASDAPIARRPISIAVFGAPGSGKSFAVKQIARSINDASNGQAGRLETIEYNVAQFRTVDDLSQAITRIASINNQQKIPLAFFDEFDCSFDGKQLGWLKYFLAPMQDGTFYGASQTITFGRALFVFAGGVSQSLSDFNPYAKPSWRRTDAERKSLDKRREFFRAQKGPDFVSRLRGHIDILSVNPDRTAVKDEAGNPMKPVLRRAFTLRGQIITLGLYTDQDDFKVATVDVDVLYALLTVDKYRHGTRSMEAILQMCTPMEDGMIEKASLPSRAQLNMHVDADEFMARVLRGRFRRFLAPGGVSHSTSVPQLAKVPAQTVTHEQEIDQAAARGDAPPAKQEAPSEAEIRKPRKKSDKKGTQRQESDVRDVESPGEPEA